MEFFCSQLFIPLYRILQLVSALFITTATTTTITITIIVTLITLIMIINTIATIDTNFRSLYCINDNLIFVPHYFRRRVH